MMKDPTAGRGIGWVLATEASTGRLEVNAGQVRAGEATAVQAVHLALGGQGHPQRARHRQKANLSARMTRISVTNGCCQISLTLFEWPIDLDLTRYTTQT